ncbi:hypothetical protein [Flavobacterium sp. 1355]|uniref:hypothetical protein n=1 Tax=Flavobacterium sp. 1355 TaxID=2806571 RepID=UPI001B61CEB1|nr:hypothetical protein [Flavobacterium sp. 1355]MBP1225240.1 hypothetical protein [Flavobacterium sp. 1355]
MEDIRKFEKISNVMDLQTRKIEFVQKFLKIQSEELISQLENLLKNKSTFDDNDFFNPMSIEEFNNRIDQSEEDFKNGRHKTTSQLLEKYK